MPGSQSSGPRLATTVPRPAPKLATFAVKRRASPDPCGTRSMEKTGQPPVEIESILCRRRNSSNDYCKQSARVGDNFRGLTRVLGWQRMCAGGEGWRSWMGVCALFDRIPGGGTVWSARCKPSSAGPRGLAWCLSEFHFTSQVSRTTGHAERPGLSQALDEVRAQRVGVLVAETVSRFAGDAAILEGVRMVLGKSKARLATADESGNADLDEDRQDFEAFMSKREIKQIRVRTKGALAVKRLRGEACSHAPWGFRRKADDSHVVRRGVRVCGADCAGCLRVEADDWEQAVIVRAKLLSDEGLSIRKIEEVLRAEGVTGRTGPPLSHTQIHRFLRPLLLAVAND